jgi:glutaredoxin
MTQALEVVLFHAPGCVTCTVAEQFLREHDVAFRSVSPVSGDDERREWRAAGSPPMPTVVIDGRAVHLLHVSQLHSLLGIGADALDARRLAWDLVSLERLWRELVAALDWSVVIVPTPARNRTIRDLVANVFDFLPHVRAARERGAWAMEGEPPELAQSFTDIAALVAYIDEHIAATERFAFEHYSDDERDPADPVVSVSQPVAGGAHTETELRYATVLAWTCNHTAGHLRQVTAFLDDRGIAHPPVVLDAFDHLLLADDPFGEGAEGLDPAAMQALLSGEAQFTGRT